MTQLLQAAAALTALLIVAGEPASLPPQQGQATFKAVASLVPISVTVRDDRGRAVTDLKQEDFEVLSDDVVMPITNFRSEPSPITIALLVDRSGSMRMPASMAAASDAAHHLISWMSPEMDRVGVFAFDVSSTQTSPFGTVSPESLKTLEKLPPYGATSLYDALDFTSVALVGDGSPRRAVVAITDGRDTASTMTVAEVASRTSTIDVPVYILSITPDPDKEKSDQVISGPRSPLEQLTTWTGGQLFFADVPAQASMAARTIVNELRQQYILAFTPDPRPGWHKLTVRTKQHHKTVRARAGYVTR
ncbi:MAG TPA: VWA domain-containing protein [Vicinamibacterales bacterium]|nr:VWA domain-containing protein [Vicinamibacterales bacterium]